MKIRHLKNGVTLITKKRPTNSVVIGVSVNVGSNDEPRDLRGICHFIEHMLFEGTYKRKNAYEITNEIERLGGEINAATGHDRTFYYVSIPSEYFNIGLDVLSDMIKNSVFDEKMVEKERNVIINEINMHKDEPRSYRWDLFLGTLYQKHPVKNPIYGKVETISSISREKLFDFYKKNYVANNISIIVVGNFGNILDSVEKHFGDLPAKKISKKQIKEPPLKRTLKKIERRKVVQSYIALGYKIAARKSRDSYVFDIISAVLGKGQSGRLFNEIRAKRGLAYDIGVYYDISKDYGYFSVYADTNKKNLERIIKIIVKEIDNLKNISSREIDEAKKFIIGKLKMMADDNKHFVEYIAYWQNIGIKKLDEYIKNIKRINARDIKRVVKKYFRNYAVAIIT